MLCNVRRMFPMNSVNPSVVLNDLINPIINRLEILKQPNITENELCQK